MKPVTVAAVIFSFLVLTPRRTNAEIGAKSLYKQIPDVTIHIRGRSTNSLLAFCREQPTMISLVYSQCGGICYPFVNQLHDKMSGIGDGLKSYRVLILSFDESDTPESMMTMAETAGLSNDSKWVFGTIEAAQIQPLTSAVGFEFVKDSSTGQFEHPPILIGVDRVGRVVRVLKKFDVSRQELWEMYRDIQGEYVPISRDSQPTLVSCFTYDPKQGGLNVSWGMLILYLPLGLGGLIVWRIFRVRRS